MSAEIQLRIRAPEGVSSLNTLKENSTIGELKREIAALVKAKPTELVLRAGFPPAAIVKADNVLLSDADISSGETIIVEVHEVEEQKIEEKKVVKAEPVVEKPKTETVKAPVTTTQQKVPSYVIEDKPSSQQPIRTSVSSKIVEEKPKVVEDKQYSQQYSKYTSDPKIVEEKTRVPEQKPRISEDKSRIVEEKLPSYSKKPENTTTVPSKYDAQSYTNKTNPTTRTSVTSIQNSVPTKPSVLDKKYVVEETTYSKPVTGLSTKESITKKTEIPTKPVQKNYRDPFYEIKNDNRDEFRRQKKAVDEQKKISQPPVYTQEELDAQLARAMQESMEGAGARKTSNTTQNDRVSKPTYTTDTRNVPKSNAPISYTSKTGRTTSSNVSNPKGSKTKDLDTKLDEEYARSFQTQLYQGNDEDPELQRHKKSHRHNKNRQPQYEAPEFYDITKQYNEENNLPTDPPLNDDPLYNPGRTDFSEFNQFGGEQDDMLQKAIQESLKHYGGGNNAMNDTLNDEAFKRILEQSKREK